MCCVLAPKNACVTLPTPPCTHTTARTHAGAGSSPPLWPECTRVDPASRRQLDSRGGSARALRCATACIELCVNHLPCSAAGEPWWQHQAAQVCRRLQSIGCTGTPVHPPLHTCTHTHTQSHTHSLTHTHTHTSALSTQHSRSQSPSSSTHARTHPFVSPAVRPQQPPAGPPTAPPAPSAPPPTRPRLKPAKLLAEVPVAERPLVQFVPHSSIPRLTRCVGANTCMHVCMCLSRAVHAHGADDACTISGTRVCPPRGLPGTAFFNVFS